MEQLRKLDVLQNKGNLNEVYALDEPGAGGACHVYGVFPVGSKEPVLVVKYQNGPRNEEGSEAGVLGADLLEMERDRLMAFQAGPFACEENQKALERITEALQWMKKRAMDRLNRQVLGTNQK